jgi:hypothetical protein
LKALGGVIQTVANIFLSVPCASAKTNLVEKAAALRLLLPSSSPPIGNCLEVVQEVDDLVNFGSSCNEENA